MTDAERRRRVEEVCDAALERAAPERAAFVAAACGSDDVLRREVEALLGYAPAAERFLAEPIGALAAHVLDDAQSASPVGRQIGPYRILSRLGAGGMGEVYRARDATLNRDVAVKMLPPAFAAEADRLARFQREAHLLASLNHPNIAHVYGLERSDDVRALVMELVEGPTLADRIAKGPIPIDEALPIAKQIAEALEAAHEQGIVHRDLKPANVKVRPDGTVKVLDFGLAKALEPMAERVDATASPTITSPALMTDVGVLLGTAAYMSPEQARGKTIDKRSDIWAFGCVVYEMLTGQRAFDGEDIPMVLASVMKGEPDWRALPAEVPVSIRTLLRSCLEKDRRRRAADIGVALFTLDHVADLVERVEIPTPGAPDPAYVQAQTSAVVAEARRDFERTARRRAGLFGATAFALGGVLSGGGVWWMTRPAPPDVIRTTIAVSGGELRTQGSGLNVSMTPDGSRIVYGGDRQLFVRELGQLEPTVLSDQVTHRGVFISPDGQWVGFFDANNTLKKVAITGGAPVTIVDAGVAPRGATWGSDGSIIFGTGGAGGAARGLQRISATGGERTALTKPNRENGEDGHWWPEFLPGGQAVLFTIWPVTGGQNGAQVAVLDLRTGTYKVVVRGGSHGRYVPTGHLVYGAGGTLHAVAFDLGRLEPLGTPVPIIEGVATTIEGGVDAALAGNGTMVYVPGGVLGGLRRSLVWVDRMGGEEALPAPSRAYQYARISPDATRVALDVRDQENDIWIWTFGRQTLTRLTIDPALDIQPTWTPDSRRVVFVSTRTGGVQNLYSQPADGTGGAELIAKSTNQQQSPVVSPDGTRLVFREVRSRTGQDLMVMPLPPRGPQPDSGVAGGRPGISLQQQPLVQTRFAEPNAEISPDGRWFAYESNQSGRFEIYVRPFPASESGLWQVSSGGGRQPLWARNGRELFFTGPDGALMGVRVGSGPTWSSTTPVRMLQRRYYDGFDVGGTTPPRTFDIAPDGRRFLMIKQDGGDDAPSARSLVVVQNWFQELERLVPTNGADPR